MGSRKSILLLFIVLISTYEFSAKGAAAKELNEEFTEGLLLRPLPDRKVLAHFHFQSSVPPTRTYGHHHHLFPKSIYQLINKFRVREMELSFTQGRWNYEQWGGYDPISSNNAKPPGVELWADFDVPFDQVDSSWKNLTHALSGLFCASINFLEDSSSYSAPKLSFRSFDGKLRYGTLPREAVCTENLTPWLKLLPCRDKAGLSVLMDRPSIYRGYYHSQRLHLTSDEFDTTKSSSGIMLEQTLTIVLQPKVSSKILQPSWSLSSLFGRKVHGKCSVSKSSNVYVQFEDNLVSELMEVWKEIEELESVSVNYGDFLKTSVLEMSASPNRVVNEVKNLQKVGPSILYEFSVEDYNDSKPFDLGLRWKLPLVWLCRQAPLRANRFLMGSGNERGGIAISLISSGDNDAEKVGCSEKGSQLRINVFQVVPWYVKVYYHTLKVFIDGELQSTVDNIEKMYVSPSEDKVSPGVMEMILRLPCGVKSAVLTLEYDKGFLHIDEYPPDANQGFDIPSAVISFTDIQTSIGFEDDILNKFPILNELQEQKNVIAYTEVLLVPLTTPDFSMPYNVITITCTVFALYFGSLLNALRRRVGEEQRLLKSKGAKKGPLGLILSKLSAKLRRRPVEPQAMPSTSSSSRSYYKVILKVMLVAGIAIGWQYYFS